MQRTRLHLVATSLPLLLGACASGSGSYPSLAIRDVERVTGSGQPVVATPGPAPAPPLDAAIGQRIDRAVESARKANTAFNAGTASAAGAVAAARGGAAASDAWISAQVALADLQTLRSAAVIAQADLDTLFAAERLANPEQTTPIGEALAQARERVDRWIEEQDRTIARLASQLRS